MKSKMFAMRMSQNDYEAIKKKAEKAKMDMTGYITSCALNKKIMVIEYLSEVLTELKGIGRNLNQLTTLCNMGRITCPNLVQIKQDFGKVFDELSGLIDRS